MNQKCEEVQELERTDSKKMYEVIREITGERRTTKSTIIKDRNGNMLTDLKDVLIRWEEYVERLYNDDRGTRPERTEETVGPPIMKSEIEHAIRTMTKGKAAGEDEVVIEMIEAAGDVAV